MASSPLSTTTRRRKLPLRTTNVGFNYDYSPTEKKDLDQSLSLQDFEIGSPPSETDHRRHSPVVLGTPTTDRIRTLTPRSERFRDQSLVGRSKEHATLDLSAHSLLPQNLQERFAIANAHNSDKDSESDTSQGEHNHSKTARNAVMRHLFGEDTKAASSTINEPMHSPPPISDELRKQQQDKQRLEQVYLTTPEHLVRLYARRRRRGSAREILKALKKTAALDWSTDSAGASFNQTTNVAWQAKRLQESFGWKIRKRNPIRTYWEHNIEMSNDKSTNHKPVKNVVIC